MPPERLAAIVRTNPALAAVLDDFAAIALPDCWLVAGCLAQTVWNHAHGFPPGHGIADIDLVYHDPHDLSAEAEAAHETRLRARFGPSLDVKNQARVHLWYGSRFGRAIAPHSSSAAAIATYPSTATAIGLRPEAGGLALCAPFGFDDLFALTVRANRRLASETVFAAKATRWARLWPRLDVRPWSEGLG
jgi:hypothetical protein